MVIIDQRSLMFYTPAQKVLRKKKTSAKRDSMSHEMSREMSHELFHPTCKTLSAMPFTKVDDAERKGQGRAASPPERGRRSKRTP